MTQTLAQPQNNADVVSTVLQLLFMGDGLHDSTWGELANENFLLLEQAIGGVATIDLSAGNGAIVAPASAGASATLTLTNDQQRPGILIFTGAVTQNVVVYTAAVPRRWLTINETTGNFTVILEPAGGTGVNLPQGASTNVFCDGTNIATPTTDTVVVGTGSDFYGVELPSNKYAWANGQALSRSTYAACFAALTRVTQATIGGGQTVVPCTEDLTARNIIGSVVEGTGVASGTTVLGVNGGASPSLILSQATTGAATQRQITLFPFGNGDGSTTFTLPDVREKVRVAPATMGGAASANITGGAAGSLGQVFGEATHLLALTEMPSHSHTLTDPGHAHGTVDPGHIHAYTQSIINNDFEGAGSGGAKNAGSFSTTTASSKTGLTISSSTTGIMLANAGGGGAHNNLQPTFVCNHIIRVL